MYFGEYVPPVLQRTMIYAPLGTTEMKAVSNKISNKFGISFRKKKKNYNHNALTKVANVHVHKRVNS
jgi:hypothetical protein